MKIVIPGKIISYKNPKIGRNNKMYSPHEMKEYQEYIGLYAKNYLIMNKVEKMENCAILIAIEAYFSIPKNYSKEKKEKILKNELLYTVYPDASNILKVVEDAVKNILFDDDNHSVFCSCSKHWSTEEQDHLIIYLDKLDKDIYEEIKI